MELVIADSDGLGLDATVEVEAAVIILHSRGGAVGSPNVRIRDYGTGLRFILGRLLEKHFEIAGAWVDSSRVQILPLGEQEILTRADFPEKQRLVRIDVTALRTFFF